jgi:hypothetical protein
MNINVIFCDRTMAQAVSRQLSNVAVRFDSRPDLLWTNWYGSRFSFRVLHFTLKILVQQQIIPFWDVTPCSTVDGHRNYEDHSCVHLQAGSRFYCKFTFLVLMCGLYILLFIYDLVIGNYGPPLWSSGQSSWLQIRRPGFDSRHYRKKSNGSGTGSTQPREYNWRATW